MQNNLLIFIFPNSKDKIAHQMKLLESKLNPKTQQISIRLELNTPLIKYN